MKLKPRCRVLQSPLLIVDMLRDGVRDCLIPWRAFSPMFIACFQADLLYVIWPNSLQIRTVLFITYTRS